MQAMNLGRGREGLRSAADGSSRCRRARQKSSDPVPVTERVFTGAAAKAPTDETSRQRRHPIPEEEADLLCFASTTCIELMWQGGTLGKQKHIKCRYLHCQHWEEAELRWTYEITPR